MAEPPAKGPESPEDVVIVLAKSDEGALKAVRKRGERIALAELRPLQMGRPIPGNEVVSLKERQGSPVLWDVEVVWTADQAPPTHKGPARVTSPRYRAGWEAIFGTGDKSELN